MTEPAIVSGSVRRRLTIQLVASAAALALGLFFVVQNLVRDVAEASHDSILVASVTSILDTASVGSGRIAVDIPYAALSMLGTVSDDRVFYRVTADGTVLTGYDDLPAAPKGTDAQGRSFLTAEYRGDAIRMVTGTRRLSLDGVPVHLAVSVAQTRGQQSQIVSRVSQAAFALGVGFFAIAAVLGVLAAQGAVRPLQRLAESVARRGPSDLRPFNAPVPTEMAPLVTSLNSLMGRLGASLARSEDFIAEAAHRVRTPLATVRAQAEVALHRVERPENRTSLKEMIRALDESSRAAGQMLDHAMVSFRADRLDVADIDIADLVAETVERLRPIADLKDIDMSVTGSLDKVTVSGDAILIQSAVRNVLDNAVKYSPAESRIDIRQSTEGRLVRISITDEGPGFPTDNRDALRLRFTRGANAEGIVGSGLGLTIADEVAQAHGGRLEIDTGQKGTGACVSLIFALS